MDENNEKTTSVDEVKPRTFRLAESVANDFTEKRNAVDLSANEFMKRMLGMIDLEEAKVMLPGRKDEIAHVEFYLREFMSSYVQSLILYQRADEVACEKNKKELEEKDALIRTLQETIKRNKETISALEQNSLRLKANCARAEKELAEAKDSSKANADVSIRLGELQKQMEALTQAAAEKRSRKPRNTSAKADSSTKEGG